MIAVGLMKIKSFTPLYVSNIFNNYWCEFINLYLINHARGTLCNVCMII